MLQVLVSSFTSNQQGKPHRVKSKITKILNSKENLKRKVPNQIAKSKVQTHQTNG